MVIPFTCLILYIHNPLYLKILNHSIIDLQGQKMVGAILILECSVRLNSNVVLEGGNRENLKWRKGGIYCNGLLY